MGHRRCRHRVLFCKIKVRPRSSRSYPLWRPCNIFNVDESKRICLRLVLYACDAKTTTYLRGAWPSLALRLDFRSLVVHCKRMHCNCRTRKKVQVHCSAVYCCSLVPCIACSAVQWVGGECAATQCIYQVNRAFCAKLKPFSRSVQLVVGSLNMRERPAPAQLSKSNSKLLSRLSNSPSK